MFKMKKAMGSHTNYNTLFTRDEGSSRDSYKVNHKDCYVQKPDIVLTAPTVMLHLSSQIQTPNI